MREDTTVLIVDDEPALRAIIARILTHHGYAVDLARDAGEALAHVTAAGPPDLLVCDLDLPGISGIELAKRIRAIRPTPVLFVSGHERSAAPADTPFLSKPFTPAQLVAAVQSAMADPAERHAP